MKCFSAASIGKGVTEESPMRSGNGFIADSLFRGLTICGLPSSAGLDPRTVTDGPIIEGEEEQKSMVTLLKRRGITRSATNFSDMLFMVHLDF